MCEERQQSKSSQVTTLLQPQSLVPGLDAPLFAAAGAEIARNHALAGRRRSDNWECKQWHEEE